MRTLILIADRIYSGYIQLQLVMLLCCRTLIALFPAELRGSRFTIAKQFLDFYKQVMATSDERATHVSTWNVSFNAREPLRPPTLRLFCRELPRRGKDNGVLDE